MNFVMHSKLETKLNFVCIMIILFRDRIKVILVVFELTVIRKDSKTTAWPCLMNEGLKACTIMPGTVNESLGVEQKINVLWQLFPGAGDNSG